MPQSRERVICIGVRSDLKVNFTYPAVRGGPIILATALRGLQNQRQPGPRITLLRSKRWIETRRGKAHRLRFSLLRLAWGQIAPTILRVSGSGGHMHPDEPRLLSIGELQRIASFPDSFEIIGDWATAVSVIGNSVPPLFMRAIAQHIRQTILETAQ